MKEEREKEVPKRVSNVYQWHFYVTSSPFMCQKSTL